MKRIVAFIGLFTAVSAFSAQEFHSWFDIMSEFQSIETWPTDGSDYKGYKCVVTNTAAATYADSRLSFNAEVPMTVVAESTAPISELSSAKVRATMKMVPFAESNFPEIPAGAKTAAIAVISGSETNFWVAAGTDELFWTNTCVAADVTKDVSIEVSVTYGSDFVSTQWTLDGTPFTCKIATVAELHGIAFAGQGELSECWADALSTGDLVSFWLTGIPEEVFVTVTTTNGSVLAKTDLGVYKYVSGGKVNLAFALPDGWKFIDGSLEWADVYDGIEDGPYTPFYGMGIDPSNIGPENGWMTLNSDGSVQRSATLDEALAVLKDGRGLMPCYSETEHAFEMAPDGKSITVDGVNKPAKSHYHYEEIYGSPVLKIDAEEATITSIGEDTSDPTQMSVGSIANSVEGFWYSVVFGDDVNMTVSPGETEPVEGNGGKLNLAAPKGDAGKRFYRIHITD